MKLSCRIFGHEFVYMTLHRHFSCRTCGLTRFARQPSKTEPGLLIGKRDKVIRYT